MPGGNLTRDEARERARLLSVDTYRITLDLSGAKDPDARTFRSTSTIVFSCTTPGASTFLDLIATRVLSVALNGEALDPAAVFADSRVTLPSLRERNEVTVVAECAYSRTGEGLHRFVDPADGRIYLYTQFEPADARRLYANFEQPDLKASFIFDISTPAGWQMSSNASPHSRLPVVEGAARWLFSPTQRISTYLTVVVAGPYHVVRDTYTRTLPDGTRLDVPLAALCRASLAEHFDAGAIFAVTKQGLDFFHDVFDYPYPFGKYDQAFVPEYNLGAMENPGCVTFTEDYVFRSKVTDAAYEGRAATILHEMAHMWFGDLVTMRWWDDLWLKESFADFMGAYAQVKATRWRNAWVTFANRRKAWAYRQDQLPTTHPVVATINDLEDAKLNFDGITYAKGASVLKQLAAYVGEESFLEGLRRYFKRHAFGNTTLADLLAALEETSGRDLATWSKAWLETDGVNTLTLVDGAVAQSGAPGRLEARPHRIAVGSYGAVDGIGAAAGTDDGAVRRVGRVELDVAGTRTPFKIEPGAFILINDEDLSYCKVYLDAGQLDWLEEHLSSVPDPMARSLAWSSLWNMTRDGKLPAERFIGLVDRHAAAETEIAVLQSVLNQTTTARDLYIDPARRPAVAELAAATALRELLAAAPGSDKQLVWVSFLADAAVSEEDFTLLEGLLDGGIELDGLTVDADKRWHMLRALAAAGRADEAELSDEVARDNTAAGYRHHAGCMAARPDAAAKAAAWRRAVECGDQPNDLLRELLGGMAQADRTDLLEPFVEPYFAALDGLWAARTIENARRIVSLGFPRLLVAQETLDRADAWLSGADHAPALRRLVLEERDDLARALNARQAV